MKLLCCRGDRAHSLCRLVVSLWLGAVWGCGSFGPENALETHGVVWGEGPIANVAVRVWTRAPDGLWHPVTRATFTDGEGRFVIEEPLPDGELLFCAAEGARGMALRAIVQSEAMRAANRRVVLTPLTEIGAALEEAAQKKSDTTETAWSDAKQAWRTHEIFAQAAHAPSLWAMTRGDAQRALHAPQEATAMAWRGFMRLAERRGRVSANEPAAWVALTRALVEDVTADGQFDGRGYRGARLSVGALSLDGDTLRATWAESLLQQAEAAASVPGEGRAQWLPLAEMLQAAGGALFPAVARDIEREPPVLIVDKSLLWCDASGRALLSGLLSRPVANLWLEREDGGRQAFLAFPKGSSSGGEHWFAQELAETRLSAPFKATLWAVDEEGLRVSQAVSFWCGAETESTPGDH